MCRCSPGHSTGTCFLDRWSVQHMLSNCRSLSSVISMYAGIVRRFPRRGCRSLAAASISCGRFFSSLPPPPLGSEQRIVDSHSRTLRWLSREKIVSTIFSKRKERKERGTIKERLFRYWKGYRVISTRNWFLQRVNTLLRALTALRESIKKGSIFYACKRSFPFTSLSLSLPYLVEIAYTIRDKKRGKGEGICLAKCK